jgi:hypothetical protein
MPARRDLEGPVHRTILAYLRSVLIGNPVIFHPASENRRRGKDGDTDRQMSAAMGVIPGIPDLVALTFHGALFFEVKAPGGRPSPHQDRVHASLRRLNYRVAVVSSIEDTRAALAAWGIPTRESALDGECMP